MVELTEKDKKLLYTLAEYGCIFNKNAKEFFGNGVDYPKRRLTKLKKHNYINATKRMVFLGVRGREYLESVGIKVKEISRKPEIRLRRAEIYKASKLMTKFQTFIPSWDIKNTEESRIKYKHRYYGILKNSLGEEFYLYRIKGSGIRENTNEVTVRKKLLAKEADIKRIKSEISALNAESRSNKNKSINVIVLIEDKYSMDIYKKDYDTLSTNKQILIPYSPQGIYILENYVATQKDTVEMLKKKIRDMKYNVTESTWSYSPFKINGFYAIDLRNSDYNQQIKLKHHLSIKLHPIYILCHKIQKHSYENAYKNAKVIAVD